ncbi:MAG: 3-oxoadipate enol-lactonase [Deltaproteobacteria bacterium]|nr:3-oxoadipate enol-lactonase [Deltaproteobacteria bacterium]
MNVTANGINIRYTIEGPERAPVVTLSHSLSTDLSMWEPQMEALTSQYRVLRYDTRGHGGTDAPEGPYSLEQLAEDAMALLGALGISRTHFIGLSMGGMIGQVLAMSHPEVLHGLILCDTSSRMPDEAKPVWAERIQEVQAEGMEGQVEPTMERWFTAPFRESRSAELNPVREMIRKTKPAGYIGCCHAIQSLDLADQISRIAVPTMVIVGEEDPGTPVEAAQAIHDQIKDSELVILKSAAHLSSMEQPKAFNDAVTGFLAELGNH